MLFTNNFCMQVAQLRQRFFHSISPGGLAGDRRGVVPASGFSFSAQQIWKVIKENKDLDLPAHKVLYFPFCFSLKINPVFKPNYCNYTFLVPGYGCHRSL